MNPEQAPHLLADAEAVEQARRRPERPEQGVPAAPELRARRVLPHRDEESAEDRGDVLRIMGCFFGTAVGVATAEGSRALINRKLPYKDRNHRCAPKLSKELIRT